MQQTLAELKFRCCRAFDKVTENTLLLGNRAQGIEAPDALAAAHLAEVIIKLDERIDAGVVAATQEHAGDTPYDMMKNRLYRAFQKITEGAVVLSLEGEGISAADAFAAAQLAETIIKVEDKLALARPAANQNASAVKAAAAG